jgi:hypothetical protein
MSVLSIEQMARNLLERAVEDGLVDPAESQWADPDPQARTPDELAGVAGILARYLRDAGAAGGAEREPAEPVIIDPPAGEDGRPDQASDS